MSEKLLSLLLDEDSLSICVEKNEIEIEDYPIDLRSIVVYQLEMSLVINLVSKQAMRGYTCSRGTSNTKWNGTSF